MDEWDEVNGRAIPQALYWMTITMMLGIVTATVLAVMLLRQNESATNHLQAEVRHVHQSLEELEQVVEARREQLDRMAEFMKQEHGGP